MKVSIITPTTGNPHMQAAVQSVRDQTYGDIQHIVVIDGEERRGAAETILRGMNFGSRPGENLIQLPYATGLNRYLGHRIYGAASFLAEGDYFAFLDEDNILESNHIQSLVELVTRKNLDWAHSFRKIIDAENQVICLDDCESLGRWPTIINERDHLVDVNCFFLARKVAVNVAPLWHIYGQTRTPGQPEADRALTNVLMNNNLRYDTTADYTVRYRVGNTTLSVTADFFRQGNARMLERYHGNLPWKQPDTIIL